MRTYILRIRNGNLMFFLIHKGKVSFLIHESFRRGVYECFIGSMEWDTAMCFSLAQYVTVCLLTMEKRQVFIPCLVKENNTAVLSRTSKTF